MTGQFQLLDAVIGHEKPRAHLKRMLENQTVPHALLFSGTAGVGKRRTAWAFACALLAQGRDQAATEDALRLITKGIHADLHLVSPAEGKKEITVEAVRSLTEKLTFKPYSGSCSVAIIDQAHTMNIAACNALLMTLEEPPGHSYLILVTNSPQRLPETIISRCQPVYFGELNEEEIRLVLTQLIGDDEKDRKLLSSIAELCQGSLDPLRLGSLIDERTMQPADAAQLTEHLKGATSSFKKFHADLQPFFEHKKEKERDKLLSLAAALGANYGANKEELAAAFRVIQLRIRNAMRDNPQNSSALADVLLQAIEAEQLIVERNLNPQIQLTSLLAALAGTAPR